MPLLHMEMASGATGCGRQGGGAAKRWQQRLSAGGVGVQTQAAGAARRAGWRLSAAPRCG